MPEASLRDVLRAGERDEQEGVSRLASRLPAMLQRARLLREEAADPRVQLALLAPRWLARMAAVAAIVAVVSLLWPSRASSITPSTALDRWVISGSAGEAEDPVLGALLQ